MRGVVLCETRTSAESVIEALFGTDVDIMVQEYIAEAATPAPAEPGPVAPDKGQGVVLSGGGTDIVRVLRSSLSTNIPATTLTANRAVARMT